MLLFRRLWLACLIWKRDKTVKPYETVTVDVTVKQKSPKNSSRGEMARNIARVELKATISL
jgi:hypothetical protein